MGLQAGYWKKSLPNLSRLQSRLISHFPYNSVLCLYLSYKFHQLSESKNTTLIVQKQTYVLFIHFAHIYSTRTLLRNVAVEMTLIMI